MTNDSWPPMSPEDLLDSEDWKELPSGPGVRILSRLWPDGSVDTLVIQPDDKAVVERTNADGHPVWRHFAKTSAAIVLVWTLPAPGELGAPAEVLPDESTDRDI